MRGILTAMAALTIGIGAAGMALAAPASAGCEGQAFAQYCDGPIRPDGTWDRCFQAAQQGIYGQWGQVTGFTPPVGRCYPVDPNAWPTFPLGQPQYHVYP